MENFKNTAPSARKKKLIRGQFLCFSTFADDFRIHHYIFQKTRILAVNKILVGKAVDSLNESKGIWPTLVNDENYIKFQSVVPAACLKFFTTYLGYGFLLSTCQNTTHTAYRKSSDITLYYLLSEQEVISEQGGQNCFIYYMKKEYRVD